MEVICKGREQKGWARELTCTGEGHGEGGCGAILLVGEDDVYPTFPHARALTCYTFRCCECDEQTDIPWLLSVKGQGVRQIPSHMLSAEWKSKFTRPSGV